MKTKAPCESQKTLDVKASFTSSVVWWQITYVIMTNAKSNEENYMKRMHKLKELISHEVFVIHVIIMSIISAGKMR